MMTLFSDIGGVLLTNGWDSKARQKAVAVFDLDKEDFAHRHDLYFPLLELGKISLNDYLEATIFYKKRPFTLTEALQFIYDQSQPLPGMREVLLNIKQKYKLRLFAISNESAELARYRYKKFHLDKLFDAYLVSAFLGLRKPDPGFYRLALDLAQQPPAEVVYIDDRPILVEAAQKLGLRAFVHENPASTWGKLEEVFSSSAQSNQRP